MAQYSGTAGSVVFLTGGTSLVGEISEWSFDGSMATVETTPFGTRNVKRIAGLIDGSGSFSGNFDAADSGQTGLVNGFLAGSAIALRLYMSASKYINIGTAFVTGFSPSISADGKGDVSYDFDCGDAYTLV